MNKTSVKSKQVSFFSIYDGSQNIHKTDYYRDNLHLVFSANEELINKDPENAIKEAILTVEKCYMANTNSMMVQNNGGFEVNTNNGRVSYSVVVTIGMLFLLLKGNLHML